jgi:DNA invertase Pin-like site-specific DNA recombinase
MQVAELREYVERRGWTIAAEYVDEGVSGAKSSRPHLDRMMADARRRKFDIVLCWRFDRFARSTSHLLAALEEFRSLGIDFVSLNESIDTTTPVGKMVFTVVASVAELERCIICERVRAGVARAVANGKRLGRPPGSKIDAKRVGELLADGLTTREIAKIMGIGVGSVIRASQALQKSPADSGQSRPMSRKRESALH